MNETELKNRIQQLETENAKLKSDLSWRTIRCLQLQTVLAARLSLKSMDFGKSYVNGRIDEDWYLRELKND